MDAQRLDTILSGLAPAEAAEIREFAGRPEQEQLVYVYRGMMKLRGEVQSLKRDAPLRSLAKTFGPLGALLAYAVVDNNWWRQVFK